VPVLASLSMPQATPGPSLGLVASYAKGREKGDKKGGKRGAQQGADEGHAADVPEFSLKPFEDMMGAAISHLQAELASMRTGRASPGLLEPVLVEAHGEKLQLKNYGAVTTRTPQLLVVTVFNPQDLPVVAQAIRDSPLQLQARVEGKEIHVPVPRLTLDMCAKLSKLVHQEAEAAKHSIRTHRHKALDLARRAFAATDERHRAEKEVQKLHDKYVAEVERLKALKDKDIKENH